MKPLAAVAAVLLLLPPQVGTAQASEAPPDKALVDQFIAVLPDRDALDAGGEEVDSAELSRLVALNPGKEAQLRAILEKNIDCTAPEITAGSLRMLRTVARNLGEARVRRLIGFYEGPDYAAFRALAVRMEGQAAPSARDSAAMARLMRIYPLQALQDQLGRAEAVFTADGEFMSAAIRCAAEQMDAMEAAGLKSN
ncbi:MAG TPA: hypothetical protein VE053_02600 [Allosphingosinicella sp.]|nr:hypothetical protein [Allosphingosinicella sp.]